MSPNRELHLILFIPILISAFPNPNGSTIESVRFVLNGCLRPDGDLLKCLKARGLQALDRARSMDRLKICEGLELVRAYDNWTANNDDRFNITERSFNSSWFEEFSSKLDSLFKTHLLKIRIKPSNLVVEARRRRHYKDLVPILVFAILAVSTIAVPLGFQFLAVLGGKALLLAKLALILTSIQGLKKIATSNYNYGLYQMPQTSSHPSWLGYDRRLQYEMAADPHKFHQQQHPDAVLDLLHPLSPRSTSGYDSS